MDSPPFYSKRKDKWDKLAETWEDAGPPASPSSEDIEHYKKLLLDRLSRLKTAKIILLGSTPKIRDMIANDPTLRNFEVVCIDFSLSMYERASKLIESRNPKERLEIADWLSFDVGHQQFDAVIGDKVIDNIMPDDWNSFFKQIHLHLRRGGYFVTHLALADDRFRDITFAKALTKWANMYDAGNIQLEDIVSGLWEDVLTASAFKNGQYYNTVKIGRFSDDVEYISNNRNTLDQTQQLVFDEFIRIFWSTKEDEWSSYKYDEILERMNMYFSHDGTVFSTDYDVASVQPIIRMKSLAT